MRRENLIIENEKELKLQIKARCKEKGITLKTGSMLIWGNDWKLPRLSAMGTWTQKACEDINKHTGLNLVMKVGIKKK